MNSTHIIIAKPIHLSSKYNVILILSIIISYLIFYIRIMGTLFYRKWTPIYSIDYRNNFNTFIRFRRVIDKYGGVSDPENTASTTNDWWPKNSSGSSCFHCGCPSPQTIPRHDFTGDDLNERDLQTRTNRHIVVIEGSEHKQYPSHVRYNLQNVSRPEEKKEVYNISGDHHYSWYYYCACFKNSTV